MVSYNSICLLQVDNELTEASVKPTSFKIASNPLYIVKVLGQLKTLKYSDVTSNNNEFFDLNQAKADRRTAAASTALAAYAYG